MKHPGYYLQRAYYEALNGFVYAVAGDSTTGYTAADFETFFFDTVFDIDTRRIWKFSDSSWDDPGEYTSTGTPNAILFTQPGVLPFPTPIAFSLPGAPSGQPYFVRFEYILVDDKQPAPGRWNQMRVSSNSTADTTLVTLEATSNFQFQQVEWTPEILGTSVTWVALADGVPVIMAQNNTGVRFIMRKLVTSTEQSVPVYDNVPTGVPYPYIVLGSQNVVEANVNNGRRITTVVADVDVVTGYDGSFGGKRVAYELSSEVTQLVRKTVGTYLPLDGGFNMLTSVLDSSVSIEQKLPDQTLYINKLRFRHKIEET